MKNVRLLATFVLSSLALAACSGGGDAPFRPGSGAAGTTLVGTTGTGGTAVTSFGASLTPSSSKRLYTIVTGTNAMGNASAALEIYDPPFTSTSVPSETIQLVDAMGDAIPSPNAMAVDARGDVVLVASNDNGGSPLTVLPGPVTATNQSSFAIASGATSLANASNVAVSFDSKSRLIALGGGSTAGAPTVIPPNRLVRFPTPLSAQSVPDLTLDLGASLAFPLTLDALAVGPGDELIVNSTTAAASGSDLLALTEPYSIVAPISVPYTASPVGSIASDANGSVYGIRALAGLFYVQGPLANLPAPTGAGNGPGAIATPEPVALTIPFTPGVGTGQSSAIALDSSGIVYAIGSVIASLSGTQIIGFSRPLTSASAPTVTITCTGTGCMFAAIAFGP